MYERCVWRGFPVFCCHGELDRCTASRDRRHFSNLSKSFREQTKSKRSVVSRLSSHKFPKVASVNFKYGYGNIVRRSNKAAIEFYYFCSKRILP